MKTSFQLETHPHPTGHQVRALLRIEGEAPPRESRLPLNLALVLDRSGSMGGGKLEAVKRAARDLILRLHPDDRVSVVAFDDQVHTVARSVSSADQPTLLRELMAMATGGSTNLSGGWLQGRALVEESLRDAGRPGASAGGAPVRDGVNRVLLLTDGHANQGITDPHTLRQLCAEALGARVSTTTVGVGAGYDENLLGDMAECGGGFTYYIERLDQTGAIFEEELEGLLSIAAQNLTVRIRPRPGASVIEVHHTYPAVPEPDGGLALTLGDLYAREPGELLVDFVVPESPATPEGQSVAVAEVTIEGDVWRADGVFERQVITFPVEFDPSRGAVSHPEVTRVFTLLEAARARREAVEYGDRGDAAGAAGVLREMAVELEDSGLDDPAIATEVHDLRQMASTLMIQEEMTGMDRKYMYTKERAYSRNRRGAGDRLER